MTYWVQKHKKSEQVGVRKAGFEWGVLFCLGFRLVVFVLLSNF